MTPGPISALAEQYLAAELAKIRAGKLGQLSATVTNQGAAAGVGVRWKDVTASAFIAKDKATGLTYGGRVGLSF